MAGAAAVTARRLPGAARPPCYHTVTASIDETPQTGEEAPTTPHTHEYFHNWSGNRVTLRDWFHLSLKEGLTVFRDQEFLMDLHSASAVRIDAVEELRSRQFVEDAGPNAHPIRPEDHLHGQLD